MKNSHGQTLPEYAVVLVLVMSAVMVMGPYVIRSWHAHVKALEDSVKDSVTDPLDQTNERFNIAPDCVCETKTPEPCENSIFPCCGAFGCAPNEVAEPVEFCKPSPPCAPPRAVACVPNPDCSLPWTNVGCNLNGCGVSGMYQERTLSNGTVMSQCYPNHPNCDKSCQYPPNPSNDPVFAQKYADKCEDDIRVPVLTDYTFISQGQCNTPENQAILCQWQCKEPFVPIDTDNDTNNGNEDCACTGDEETRVPYLDTRTGKLTCCGVFVDQENCPAGQIRFKTIDGKFTCPPGEVLICKDSWKCCPTFNNATYTTKKTDLSAVFNQVAPGFDFNCDDLQQNPHDVPHKHVIIGIETKYNGSLFNNDWRFKCRDLPSSCFTGSTTTVTKTAFPSTAIWETLECPTGSYLTGVGIVTSGTTPDWTIHCAQINPSCMITTEVWNSPDEFETDPTPVTGNWVGDESLPCTLINTIEAKQDFPPADNYTIHLKGMREKSKIKLTEYAPPPP